MDLMDNPLVAVYVVVEGTGRRGLRRGYADSFSRPVPTTGGSPPV